VFHSCFFSFSSYFQPGGGNTGTGPGSPAAPEVKPGNSVVKGTKDERKMNRKLPRRRLNLIRRHQEIYHFGFTG
jgi:hypothetical protein